MLKISKIQGVKVKTESELAAAQAAQNAADIEYLAMMLDVELDEGDDMNE